MRHPNEIEDDDISKLLYQGNFFEDDISYSGNIKGGKTGILKFLKNTFAFDCFSKKGTRKGEEIFSTIPEIELNYLKKELTDTCVQTGVSLEIARLNPTKTLNDRHSQNKITPRITSINDSDNTLIGNIPSMVKLEECIEELNILKFLRQSRTDSINSNSIQIMSSTIDLEKEIKSHEYEAVKPSEIAGPSSRVENFEPDSSEWTKQTHKHLRFEEEPTIIPASNFEDAENDSGDEVDLRRSRGSELNKSENYNNAGKRFWGKGKNKKRPGH